MEKKAAQKPTKPKKSAQSKPRKRAVRADDPSEELVDTGYTHTNSTLGGGNGRDLMVVLMPDEAAKTGFWQLGGREFESEHTEYDLVTTQVIISVTDVIGFLRPVAASYTVPLTQGYLTTATATYNGFERHPASTTVTTGSFVSFRVRVSGKPTSYQWQFKAPGDQYRPLQGKTTPVCSLRNVTGREAGRYRVVVTWSNGPLNSNVAVLNVTA